MNKWLFPAAVVGLAVGLACLVLWVNKPQPVPPAPHDTPAAVAPAVVAAAPAPLPPVVDVLDIDPLLDPPSGPSDAAPAGPVVTAFGDDPLPQPVRPASAVTPIPPADEPGTVEVAPMPREVTR
jgi:hypothetical protein